MAVDQETQAWVKNYVAGVLASRLFARSQHQRVSSGTASGNLPMATNHLGQLDPSFIDTAGLDGITELIADTAGAMFTGNTETGITVTYEDSDNTVDFVVSDEFIADTVGAMVSSNTETGITVTYQDADNTLDFELVDEYLQDVIGAMVASNVETGIAVTYDDTNGKLDFDAQTAGDARYVALTGAQSISGVKTFSNGIAFANETLSTFDEDTSNWTPAIQGSGSNPTVNYSSRIAIYLRFNGWYFVFAQAFISTISGGSGDLRLSLPATTATTTAIYAFTSNVDWPSGSMLSAACASGTSYARFISHGDNIAPAALQISGLANGDDIGIMGFIKA